MTDEELVRVAYEDEDGDVELISARPLGGDRYALASSPLLAYGLSYGDVVVARPAGPDGALVIAAVERKSGHRTLRLEVSGASSEEPVKSFFARLRAAGCSIVHGTPSIVALDVPPGVDVASVRVILDDDAFECAYETADPPPEPA